VQSNVTDKYVAGPLLSAYKQCVVGPPEVLNVPSWLGYSFGPVVSIDSGASTGTDTVSGPCLPGGKVLYGTAATDEKGETGRRAALRRLLWKGGGGEGCQRVTVQ